MQVDNEDNESRTPGPMAGASDNDPRFEVKWQKKAPSSAAPVPPSDVQTEEPADAPALQHELDEARNRITDLQDRWHRAAADLANLRKRTEQEKAEVEKFAAIMIVAELLPVLDNFERALATIPGNLGGLTWIQGVMLIERHFRAILEHVGVEPIDANAKQFDPHLHEAISERETDAVPEGFVAAVLQQGYLIHGRVLRPALVELATAPAVETNTESTDDEAASEIVEEAELTNPGP